MKNYGEYSACFECKFFSGADQFCWRLRTSVSAENWCREFEAIALVPREPNE